MKRQDAIDHFASKIEKEPRNAEGHHNLAVLMRADENVVEYMRRCRIAVIADPNKPSLHNEIGLAFFNINNLSLAFEHFNEALRLDPLHYEANVNLSALYARKGKFELALRHSMTALKRKPNCTKVNRNIAKLMYELGRSKDALFHNERALRYRSTSDSGLYRDMAVLNVARGKNEDAIKYFSQCQSKSRFQ